jgi:NAD(P)-dependent dehydrogenase (short-subunit alcohol dehydrogenase family)
VSARRPDKLENAVAGLEADGLDVQAVPANVADEEEITKLFEAHRERFGRLDVLVNNAGVGIGQTIDQAVTKHVDMQIGVNLRSAVLATREAIPMLKEAGAEHGKALIVNTASIAGKSGEGWLSVYSATKAGLIGFTEASQKELGGDGIQVTAFCPAFVDTAMTEWARENVDPKEMIQPEDLGEAVRFLLRTSRYCLVPEIIFTRHGQEL